MELEDQKKIALFNYLKADGAISEDATLDDMSADGNYFEIEGKQYTVYTDEEADNATYDYIKETIDEMGLDAFTESFQYWIINNAMDQDWFEDASRELIEYHVEDMSSDEIIEWGIDKGLTTEEEAYGKDEDGEVDYTDPNYSVVDDLKSEYVEEEFNSIDDYVEYYRDQGLLDDGSLKDYIKEGRISLDLQKIVDECIWQDGRGHFLSGFNSEELELDGDFYAYRQN